MPDNELFKTSLNKAMALCSKKEYCTSEILVKLHDWGTDFNDSIRILGLLKKENFINEERYTRGFVRDKFNFNKWGRIKIASHLKGKNIPGEKIKMALDTIDNETYKKTLTNLLSAHRRTVKAKNQLDLKAKLMRYGLSKGFESNLLYDLLNTMDEL
jgi:regulatory protein